LLNSSKLALTHYTTACTGSPKKLAHEKNSVNEFDIFGQITCTECITIDCDDSSSITASTTGERVLYKTSQYT